MKLAVYIHTIAYTDTHSHLITHRKQILNLIYIHMTMLSLYWQYYILSAILFHLKPFPRAFLGPAVPVSGRKWTVKIPNANRHENWLLENPTFQDF